MRAEKGRQAEIKKNKKVSRSCAAQQKHHNTHTAIRHDDIQSMDQHRKDVSGRGSWKRWVPNALLRCMFATPNTRDDSLARQHNASHTHCRNVRFAGADLLTSQLEADVDATMVRKNLITIHALQCDETHFTVQCNGYKPCSKSILGSHGLITTVKSLDHDVQDRQEPMPPRALENQTAATMFNALEGTVAIPLVLDESMADWRGTVLASDHAKAMDRLQGHVENISVGKQFTVKAFSWVRAYGEGANPCTSFQIRICYRYFEMGISF